MDSQPISHDDNASDEGEEHSRYQVVSRREIVSIFRSLASHNQLITMQADNKIDPIMTSVLEVDEASDMVFIDCGRDATVNRQLAAGRNISFTTALDNIRIHFTSPTINLCEFDGKEAFSMPIPPSLVRLQRREYYRVPTPITNPVRCEIKLRDEAGKVTKTLSLPLHNISGGGIAVVDESRQLDDSTGKTYRDCKIDLPGGGSVMTALEIRNSYEIKLNNGKTIRRIGCLFVDLSSVMTSTVQRYIAKLERERAAKSKGLG